MSNMNYKATELMAVAGSKELLEGQNVVVGLGLPQVATLLAKYTHAPNLNIILEIGVLNPSPEEPSIGIADPRMWYKATYYSSYLGVMGNMLQRGEVDVGFLGGLEIDQYGNLNSTQINNPDGTMRHFTGSGGANDIASYAQSTVVIMPHQKRKMPEKVQYITSTGYLEGDDSRSKSGLKGKGPLRLITDMAVLGYDQETGRMQVESLHPGVKLEEVQENTGFELLVKDTRETPAPSEEQLRLLREVIDPDGIYLK